MSNEYTIGDGTLLNIANAIRAQESSTGGIAVSDFASRVSALTPVTEEISADITNENTKYYGTSLSTLSALGAAITSQDGLTSEVRDFARRILALRQRNEIIGDIVMPFRAGVSSTRLDPSRPERARLDHYCFETLNDIKERLAAAGFYYSNIDDYKVAKIYLDFYPDGLTRHTGYTHPYLKGMSVGKDGVAIGTRSENWCECYIVDKNHDGATIISDFRPLEEHNFYITTISAIILYKEGALDNLNLNLINTYPMSYWTYNMLIDELYTDKYPLPVFVTKVGHSNVQPFNLNLNSNEYLNYSSDSHTNHSALFAPFETVVGESKTYYVTPVTKRTENIFIPSENSVFTTGTAFTYLTVNNS